MIQLQVSISAPSLPQKDGIIEQGEREIQLFAARDIYEYNDVSDLPMPMGASKAALVQVPGLLDWVEGQGENQLKILADLQLWRIATRGQDEFSTLADYAKVFLLFKTPDIVEKWQDDKVFGSQRLGGLNPMTVKLVTTDGQVGANWTNLSAKLSPRINDDAIKKFLGPNATIAEAINQKRLYVTDFASLAAVVASDTAPGWQKGQRLMGPIALYVRTDDFPGLQPIAIQLNQTPDSAVYLASEETQPGNQYKWLMAKIFLQCADLNIAQVVNHLTFTHLIEEAFALATHRRLAWQHPVYILLSKHFTALLVINELGVLTLVNPTGIIQQILEGGLGEKAKADGSLQLIKNAYQDWTFEDMDFQNNLAKRGVDDTGALPYYPYRDDGLLIWDLLGQYIQEYLDLYYVSDNDVVTDYELQAWAQQLSGALDDGVGKVPGFPSQVGTRAQLADIVRRIIWTAGPQHAAVNFPDTEYMAFVPNAPGATYTPPIDGDVDEAAILRLLPPKDPTGVQVQTSFALAGYRYDQLLDYQLNTTDGSQAVVTKYYNLLKTQVRNLIEARNKQRGEQAGLLVYPYFLPENIPNSTSV